jgi:hypothetical protein
LYLNAKGKPPSFVGNEAGFDSPNTDDDNNSPIPHLNKRKREAEDTVQHTKEAQKKVSTMLDRVGLLMEKLEDRNSTSIKDGATPDGILHQLCEAIEQQPKLWSIPLTAFKLWPR